MDKLALSSLYQLTCMRMRVFARDPEGIFWVLFFPLLLSFGLGLAFRNAPAEVVHVGASTRGLSQALGREKQLSVETFDLAPGENAITTGKIVLFAIAKPDGVTYKYDSTNPNSRTARLLADRAIQSAAGGRPTVPTSDSLIRENGSRYIDFVIPGVLGMNLLGSAIWWLTSVIVEARQKQLLKRLVGSPMPRWQYLGAFPLSSLCLFVVQISLFLVFARFVFGVPFRGQLWELGILCLLAAISFTAIGLLISARAKTMEAANGLINLVALPMWILSGVFFSSDRFPRAIQPLIHALPLTAAIDAFRANMLQGVGMSHLLGPIAVLAAWSVMAFLVALKIFSWR